MKKRIEHGRTLVDTMVCWNANPDATSRMALVGWPDCADISGRYESTNGACSAHVRNGSLLERKVYAFEIAMKLVVQYGIDPVEVHRTMMGLFEYRDTLADDSMFLYDYLKKNFPEEFEERYC